MLLREEAQVNGADGRAGETEEKSGITWQN